MRFARLGGEDDELADACPLLPGLDKFVHDPMQRAPPQGGAARERVGRRVDAELHRRRAQDPELRRQIVGEMLHDDRVAAERQMGPCCSVVPTGTTRPGRSCSRSRTAPGVISFIRQGRPD